MGAKMTSIHLTPAQIYDIMTASNINGYSKYDVYLEIDENKVLTINRGDKKYPGFWSGE